MKLHITENCFHCNKQKEQTLLSIETQFTSSKIYWRMRCDTCLSLNRIRVDEPVNNQQELIGDSGLLSAHNPAPKSSSNV